MKRRTNKSLIVGLLLGFALVGGSIAIEIQSESAKVFLHPVALLIVVGGCVAASLISRPSGEILASIRLAYYAVRAPKNDFVDTAIEIVRLCKGAHADPLYFDEPESVTRHGLLIEAIHTLNLGFPADEVRRHLERRRDDNETDLQNAADLAFSLAKLGPAFGLLGTLVGLIVMLYYHMASGEMTKVASSMGIALTATLYGVALSNLVFGPLGEYLSYAANQSARLDALVVEGAMMLRERRHPLYVVQAVRVGLPRDSSAEFGSRLAALDAAIDASLGEDYSPSNHTSGSPRAPSGREAA